MTSQELTHPYLVHPRTGEPLRAIGLHPKTGRPLWPIMGGSGDDPDANDPDPENDDPDNDPDNDPDADPDNDPDNDDPDEDARVKRANKQAAKYRTDLRKTQDQLTAATTLLDRLKKAVGGEDDDDPTAKVTAATEKVATLEAETAALQAELLVTKLAPKHKANAEALLDSQKFTKALAGLDPADDDYDDQVAEAIKDAVKKNAAYRAGQGSAKGGSEMDPDKRERTKGKRPKGLGAAIGAAYKS